MYIGFGKFHPGSVTPIEVQTKITDITLVIDAGHGGEDGGAVGADGTLEKDINLSVAIGTAQILKSNGFNVILTRDSDKMLSSNSYSGKKKQSDLTARVEMTDSCENPVFISIHMNKFPDSRCKGAQVYYSKNNEKSKELAKGLQTVIRENLQNDNKREIKEATSAIYVLNNLHCPAVLVECGFLSNPEDLQNLKNEDYQKKLSVIISAAIMNGVINERT